MTTLVSKQQELPVYYKKEIGESLGPEVKQLLIEYSGVPEEELVDHIHAARDKAWAASPWPCVGQFSFLQTRLRTHPSYGQILEDARSASPGSYLVCDVGCGLGQELRCLAADGVPSANLRAVDIKEGLWNSGFDLFRDKEQMGGAKLITGNILDIEAGALKGMKGSLDVMIAALFLHCFDYDGQLLAATNLASFAKDKKGSMIIGWQLGGEAKHVQSPRSQSLRFRHNEESFRNMWKQVEEKTGQTWHVKAEVTPLPKGFLEEQKDWIEPGTTILSFTVTRG